jgi:hypothetical protein
MTGMEMLMKQFGIDPEKIKAELSQVFKDTLTKIDTEFKGIKDSQERIEAKLDFMGRYLSKIDIIGALPVIESEPDNGRDSGSLDTASNN